MNICVAQQRKLPICVGEHNRSISRNFLTEWKSDSTMPRAASCNSPLKPTIRIQYATPGDCRRRQEPPLHGVRHCLNPFPRRRTDRAGPPKPIADSSGEQPASHYLKENAMTPTCKSTKQLTAFPLRSITDTDDDDWIFHTGCSDGSSLLNASLHLRQLFLS